MVRPLLFEDLVARFAALLRQGDQAGLRDELVGLLALPDAAAGLQALDGAGLLTQIIPELEPARLVDQPIVHFLPVLAHSLEAVRAVDWLFGQVGVAVDGPGELPAAVRERPELRYHSRHAAAYRSYFAAGLEGGRPRGTLFKLAALLHDVAKPQTKQPKPGGGVSFHDHQTIGADVAEAVAGRLGFEPAEVAFVGLVVREHMRPGQLTQLDEVTLRAVRRFFQATGDDGPGVLLHSLADHMATRGPTISVEGWFAHCAWTDAMLDTAWGGEVEIAAPLLTGHDVLALGVPRGPQVGRVLAAVGEAQAGGDITTREEALALAQRIVRNG